MGTRKRLLLCAGLGLLAVPAVVGIGNATSEEFEIRPPSLRGDWDRGILHTQLYRGGSVPDEVVVMATPDDCQNHLDLTVTWDEEENTVIAHVKGEHALDPHPTVYRTEGVDFFPNPWWPETKDVVDGHYLLWFIHVIESIDFYYDVDTLELIGSEEDYDTPPEPAITVPIPAFVAVPTDYIEVQENGDVDWTYTFDYDGLKRGTDKQFTHFVASFIPHSLCTANPYDYTVSSSRPYAGPTLPASEAIPFSEYVRNGLIFDITVEPDEQPIYPPISTNVVTYSQALTVAGGIPKGWTNDLEAVFANLSPPIRPFEAADNCTDYFKPVRTRDYNICEEGGEQ